MLAELASVDTESVATVCGDELPMDWRDQEAQGEAVAIAQDGMMPRAFVSAMGAQEVERLAAAEVRTVNFQRHGGGRVAIGGWRERGEKESRVVHKGGACTRSFGEGRRRSVEINLRTKSVKGLGKKIFLAHAKNMLARGRTEGRYWDSKVEGSGQEAGEGEGGAEGGEGGDTVRIIGRCQECAVPVAAAALELEQ